MKKLLFLAILVLLPCIAIAQKIDSNLVDEFTGKSVIRTEWLGFDAKTQFDPKLKSKKTFHCEFMFRYEDGEIFLHIKWVDSTKTISKGLKFQLKLKDGSILTLEAIADFIADTRVSASWGDGYNLIHAVYQGAMDGMTDLNQPEKVRISTIYGADVFDIDSKNARRLTKAYKLIQDEIKKSE